MLLYRILMTILLAAMQARQGLARLTGNAGRDGPNERLRARGPLPAGTGALVWVHGASNGEMAAVRPLLTQLMRDRPVRLLLTTNSRTARDMVAGWGLARTAVRLAPLDHPWLVGPFLRDARPAALVILENELWPERLLCAAAANIPVLVLGGRLSAGSARNWSRFPAFARRLMAAIRWLAPQDAASGERFRSLGLAPDRIGPVMVLKALASPSPTEAPDLPFPRAATLLAASTHEGEEEVVLAAFATLLRNWPEARLILAPRHPRRSAEIVALIVRQGFSFATRSLNQPVTAETQVYLADTMGEMALWYQAAGLTFVGGSLAERGGHTPFEPAAFGSAILHGPSLANFAAPYHALAARGAAVEVRDAAGLATELARLLGNPAAQADLTAQARAALAPFAANDPVAPFLAALDQLVPELRPGDAAA